MGSPCRSADPRTGPRSFPPRPVLADLLELQSFTVTSSPTALALSAFARMLTPLLPTLPFTVHRPACPPHPAPPRARTGLLHAPRASSATLPSVGCASAPPAPTCSPAAASVRASYSRVACTCVAMRGVLPDVLVLDGAVPQPDAPPNTDSLDLDSRPGAGAPHPLSRPLPPRAFAHIRPDAWLNATSVRAPLRVLVASHITLTFL